MHANDGNKGVAFSFFVFALCLVQKLNSSTQKVNWVPLGRSRRQTEYFKLKKATLKALKLEQKKINCV